MELTRGVIGLAQNQAVLHRFFLIAPFLSALSKQFCNKNQITTVDYSQHYQMSGLTNQRISNNAKKMIQVYDKFNLDFNDNASVFNAISKVVLPDETVQIYCSMKISAKKCINVS